MWMILKPSILTHFSILLGEDGSFLFIPIDSTSAGEGEGEEEGEGEGEGEEEEGEGEGEEEEREGEGEEGEGETINEARVLRPTNFLFFNLILYLFLVLKRT